MLFLKYNKLSKVFNKTRLSGLVTLAAPLAVEAAPSLDPVGDPAPTAYQSVMGVENLYIGGLVQATYNVTFVEGNCADVFNGGVACDGSTTFTFDSKAKAVDAANALARALLRNLEIVE